MNAWRTQLIAGAAFIALVALLAYAYTAWRPAALASSDAGVQATATGTPMPVRAAAQSTSVAAPHARKSTLPDAIKALGGESVTTALERLTASAKSGNANDAFSAYKIAKYCVDMGRI